MRVLLLNQVFHPDVAATAQHAHDLAKHLVEHGHDVTVIASRSIYGQKGAALPKRQAIDGIDVRRVGRSLFGKAGLFRRGVDFACFFLAAMVQAFIVPRPDVTVCFTTPPYIALIGWLLKILRRTPYVYWSMDVYPDVLVAHGILKERKPLTNLLNNLNVFLMRKAARVVVLGRCMMQLVEWKGVDPHHIEHISVWSDHEEIRGVARENNPFISEWNVGECFLLMYAGNIGLVHDVDTMCSAAEKLKDRIQFAFAFVGEGKRKNEIESRFDRRHPRVIVAPHQPRERLDALLSAADAHLISLREGYEGLVVPSKLYGIMAAGKPAIFIGPAQSEIARVLTEHQCGIVIRPGDVQQLINAIAFLADNPDRCRLMGQNGRQALKQRYDRAHACAAWQRLLEQVARPADRRPEAAAQMERK